MNTATTHSPMAYRAHRPGFFARAEAWLDERGDGAWIAAMVVSFIFFWPIGLALLAYMIWSKKMFSKSCKPMARARARHMSKPSGNTAFDAYKAETLQRLEEEQHSFEEFLKRLREAKDKAEFDQFMNERAKAEQTDDTPRDNDANPA